MDKSVNKLQIFLHYYPLRAQPLHLTPEEKRALLAFLRSLTGDNVDSLAKEADPHAE